MRVADDLKPHNIETIIRTLYFFRTERKCCAIQATGTGKTFLILRLLEILNDDGKVAVIFAPNNEIIRQTKKRMKKFGLNNVTFYTYQKLARMTDEELSAIKTDLIVCDELHRTGAKTWGQKFERLVNLHPDSKIFGVTATPLRCADGRDMAEEYFDGNKACDISLAEALVREIIPVMPLYISALYTFEEEYQKMNDKIEKANNSNEEKVELQKELLAAKQQLEKANGVPEIIKKYITNYNGKYIVFCKDIKHLYAMKDVVIGWFRDAGYDGKILEYPYYSNNSKVKKNLFNFEKNTEEGLKLLFVIDKLNEGLHLDEIDGCILLRTTVSNIIYYQQIGRAIDAGSNEQRVILDLVSNFNSLKEFNLKKELKDKVIERRSGKFSDCSEEFELDKFDVVDCVQECVDVFSKIDLKIIADRREWNKKEKSILTQFYPIMGIKVKEKLPNRTKESIQNMAYNLGLVFQDSWTDEEYDILRTNYPKIGVEVRELLNNRTDNSIKCMAKRLGIKNRDIDYWNENEDDILKVFYPIEGRRVFKRLKNRTMQQCQTRAKKLGLRSNNKNAFTNEEVQILKEFYPIEGKNVYKRLRNRTAASCANYCKAHGIKRIFSGTAS
jgi:superfamily II DNA or RNA helicase